MISRAIEWRRDDKGTNDRREGGARKEARAQANSAGREGETGVYSREPRRDFSRRNVVNIRGRDERYHRWQRGARMPRRSRHIIRARTIRAKVSRKIRPIPINPRMAIHKYLTVRARRPASERRHGKPASWPTASRIFSDCSAGGGCAHDAPPANASLACGRESALTTRSLLKSLTERIYRPGESN